MAAVGTWAFSLPAVEKIQALVLEGAHSSDCIEAAMAGVENNPETGPYVVGRGGYPNKDGIVQCDAAIMEGHPGRFGAVAALTGVGTPLAVARKVMEKSPHSMLVGSGALAFAREHGFTIEDNVDMMSEKSSKAYEMFLEEDRSVKAHDTLGLIALDLHGNITVGVSTSGAPFKYPGRVGDSPLPGCGLYADIRAGAAAATGDGDKIMCYCPTFHVVQLMKQGLSPTAACRSVIQDVQHQAGKNMFEFGLIAMNMKGEVGVASSVPFPYVVWSQGTNIIQQFQQSPCSP